MIDMLFVKMCSVPNVSEKTLWEIIRVESSFNELAINVNDEGVKIKKPVTRPEAVTLAKDLIQKGYSVDLGLMQVNSKNLLKLGLSVEDAFDGCRSLSAGSKILKDNYGRAASKSGEGQAALVAALSAYNTGNFRSGISNGYVSKVYGEKIVLKREPPAEASDQEDAYPYFQAEE